MSAAEGLLAIVGGTGFHLRQAGDALEGRREETVETRWGRARLTRARCDGREIVFLDRHHRPDGGGGRLPPHRIDYRANIAALKKLGVTGILASSAVGSLRAEWRPGTLVLLDQLLDATTTRHKTFFDDAPVHVDMTEPYCSHLRSLLKETARQERIEAVDGGIYIATEGPRFETPAEIRAFQGWGADVVGMTGVPEVVLAREAEISYAGLSVVTNPAAGISSTPLTEREVVAAMEEAMPTVARLFLAAARTYRDDPEAPARRATREFGRFHIT